MKKLILLFSLTGIFFLPAWAVKVPSLYHAQIPVSSQLSSEREQAVKQGLIQVLIKVSGDPEIEKNLAVKPTLSKADYYVQEYNYTLPSASSAQYFLQIHYNKADINRLLKKAGVSVWGENRPLLLVWLVFTDRDQNTQLIGEESSDDLLAMMKLQSQKYGLPLIFPMMDMTDLNQITAADVAAKTLSVLQNAAKRYAPEGLLIGKIEKEAKFTNSQWELILNNQQWQWAISDVNTESAITSVLNQISQTLAQRDATKVKNISEIWLTLEVSNITERHDLTQLLTFLKQLSVVQQVNLSQVSGDMVELTILIRGTLATFQQNISVDQHLVLKSQESMENKLVYEWKR